LEYPQELCLKIRPERADLVKEDGATLGQLEFSELSRLRPSKRSFLVAEELGIDQGVGERRDVEGDERLSRPGADRRKAKIGAGAGLAVRDCVL